MGQTPEEIGQPLAERRCGEVARRDDGRVARRQYRKPRVEGVYRLDAGAWLDDCCHFLQAIGVMGLLVAEFAQATGAGRVIVVGRGARLAKAAALGHETLDFEAEDTVEGIRERTGGLGPEVALECSGDPRALGQCASFVRKVGRVAVIGIPMESAGIPLQRVVLDEVDIVGVRAAAGEMPEAIALVAAGKIRLGELITHRFALDDFADAYATFTERRDGALKVIVRP